ncbi:MAG: GC-type dockerin domain-anchored protein, partial [Actinomycetota bacterium]|nr:GC-type dockerin domain-anchored protein [Actinomycetota bacterium]
VPDCPGDATGDAVVDGQDLAAVLAAWGADVPDVDQNGDGTIDGQDLAAVLAAWGLPCGQ